MDISDLIRSIDIVDFISQFMELEQRGDEWWGLSCFRDEKTPSFSIRRDPPFFYDYSAGFGGNVYTFVKEYYKCSPTKAVQILKEFAGYEGDLSQGNGKMDALNVFRKYQKKEKVQKPSTSKILPDDYMNRYEKKLDKMKIWFDEGISLESMEKYQVRYDPFSNRLVYPIRDLNGNIVNVGGRTLDPEWKEKGQRKYCYFYSWGTINTIYGVAENIEAIKKKKEIIIFEGCKSVLLADSWGIENAGAILTSHLSSNQMKILAKLGYDVVFALDKEIRIRDDKNIQKLKKYINVYYICDIWGKLDEKDSPVDKGREVFTDLYARRFKLR